MGKKKPGKKPSVEHVPGGVPALARRLAGKAEPEPPKAETKPPEPETPLERGRDDGAGMTTDPRADLGYPSGKEWQDFTPDQRRAFRETFTELKTAKSDLQLASDKHASAVETCKELKASKTAAAGAVLAFRERLEAIAAGGPLTPIVEVKRLPGADAAAAVADFGEPPVPNEIYNRALDHVAAARAKGKGLDAKSLSLALFGSRRKENRPRCEQLLGQLVARGIIVADESADEAKPRFLPAGKDE